MSEPAGLTIFSLSEARNTLPLIRPIVADVIDCHNALREHLNRKKNSNTLEQDVPTDPSWENPSAIVTERRKELSEYVHELYDLGAEIHDFEQGRIDFPARKGHRVVYLCWELNDDDICHWHDTYASCHKRESIQDEEFE